MANSSFYKNVGTSTQLQGSASASAAAALASEQAALASKNAAAVSETNSAASAASALVHSNAASSSASSINANAISTAADVVTSAGHAATATANATTSTNAATATAADLVLTNADVVSTNGDATQTAADRVQTGLDVTASSASAAAALVSKNASATSETNAAASATSSAADATATAADRVQTGLDRTATNGDATQTAADRVQTGLDVTASASSASAASSSASAASASQVAAAASAAAAENSYDQFDDRYLGSLTGYATAQTGPALDNDGNALVSGTLFFSADANEMRVYDGAGWIAASSAGSASLNNYHYTATASQTTFSGSDENSNTLSYTVENLIVTRNGIVLEDGTDYTATNGTSVVLAVAAAVNDEINIVAFKSFTTADMVSATNGGTFQSNVTVNGTMTATAFSGDGSALTGITIPTLSSLGIANHDQVTVTAGGAVTATSFSGDGSSLTGIPTPTLTSLGIPNHDDITVDGSANVGIDFTPKTMNANVTSSLNVGSGTVFQRTKDTFLGSNMYYNASDAGTSISTGYGLAYYQDVTNGSHQWFTSAASAASADAAHSFTIPMTIDSSGRVTMPAQPAFHAYGTSTSWVIFSNGSWTKLVLNATPPLNVGSHYDSTNSKFVAPVAGVYHFYYKVYGRVQSGGGASTYWQARFQKNNNAISGYGAVIMAYQYTVGGTDEIATYSANILLAANDEITVHAQAAGSHNGEYYGIACEFGGHLIG